MFRACIHVMTRRGRPISGRSYSTLDWLPAAPGRPHASGYHRPLTDLTGGPRPRPWLLTHQSQCPAPPSSGTRRPRPCRVDPDCDPSSDPALRHPTMAISPEHLQPPAGCGRRVAAPARRSNTWSRCGCPAPINLTPLGSGEDRSRPAGELRTTTVGLVCSYSCYGHGYSRVIHLARRGSAWQLAAGLDHGTVIATRNGAQALRERAEERTRAAVDLLHRCAYSARRTVELTCRSRPWVNTASTKPSGDPSISPWENCQSSMVSIRLGSASGSVRSPSTRAEPVSRKRPRSRIPVHVLL